MWKGNLSRRPGTVVDMGLSTNEQFFLAGQEGSGGEDTESKGVGKKLKLAIPRLGDFVS